VGLAVKPSDRTDRERRVFSRLALRLVDAKTPHALAVSLCEACAALFDLDAFHFAERVPDTDLFRRVYAEDRINDERQKVPPQVAPTHYQTLPELHEGKALLINRPADRSATEPGWENYLQRFGDESRFSASLLFAPVTIGGSLFGTVSVQSYETDRFNEEDLGLLKALADLAAPTLRRMQAEDALRLNQERYRQAIEQADAVPYEKDYATSRLIYMGEGIQRLTGYTPDDLTRDVWRSMIQEVILHGELAGLPLEEATRRAKGGEVRTYRADYRIRTREGRERWLADSAINLVDARGTPYGSLGILQDSTERMRTVALSQALSQLGRLLGAAVTPREVAQVVVETADELIGWDACYLDMYSAEEGTVHAILSVDTVGQERREFPSVYEAGQKPGPMLARTLNEGPVLILRESPEEAKEMDRLPWGDVDRPSLSLMAVPVRERGKRPIGVLSIQSYRLRAYGEEDLELLEGLADHCAGALERTVAEERLRRSEEQVAAFAALAHRLNAVTTPREAGLIIADTAERLLGWDSFLIDLHSPEEGETDGVLDIDTLEGKKTEFRPVNAGNRPTKLQERVVREGALLIHRTPEEAEKEGTSPTTLPFGDGARRSLSILYVPARKGDRVVGFLSIQSYRAHAYSAADRETFQALADHCAGALERLRIEKKLVEERNLLRTLVDNLPDCIYVKDREGRFVLANPAQNQLLGAATEEAVLGRTDRDFLPRELAEAHVREENQILQSGVGISCKEEKISGRKRKIQWVSATRVPLRDAEGRVAGIVGIARDITDSKRAREALARQARELARSNAELEDFASIASHDLQEPLRKIVAFGERLKARVGDHLDAQAFDYLDRMQNAAGRMQTLIQDLLAFSRVTTRAHPFERVDLARLVQEVVTDLEVRIEQVGGRVEIGALPTLQADPLQMRQLFQNLIGNSLKFYKPKEPPVVWVHNSPPKGGDPNVTPGAPGLCFISVEDNGIGFEEKFAERIFAPFQRLHGRREYEGTGIGLAVCRKIVERHGGTLTARSAPDRGSTFLITLPASQPEDDRTHA